MSRIGEGAEGSVYKAPLFLNKGQITTTTIRTIVIIMTIPSGALTMHQELC